MEHRSDNIDNGSNNLEFTKNDIFQLKIYETYFVKHISLHFDRVFKILIKNEEMYLSSIKFKNMYIIELSSNTLIFDLLACRVIYLLKKFISINIIIYLLSQLPK